MSGHAIRALEGGIAVAVRLTPKGGRDAIEAWDQDASGRPFLKARVTAPPEKGKANEALVALLAKAAGVARSKVRIASGDTARMKIVEIDGNARVLIQRLTGSMRTP